MSPRGWASPTSPPPCPSLRHPPPTPATRLGLLLLEPQCPQGRACRAAPRPPSRPCAPSKRALLPAPADLRPSGPPTAAPSCPAGLGSPAGPPLAGTRASGCSQQTSGPGSWRHCHSRAVAAAPGWPPPPANPQSLHTPVSWPPAHLAVSASGHRPQPGIWVRRPADGAADHA